MVFYKVKHRITFINYDDSANKAILKQNNKSQIWFNSTKYTMVAN